MKLGYNSSSVHTLSSDSALDSSPLDMDGVVQELVS